MINKECVAAEDCASRTRGRQCWETVDVACCRRNDKKRCCFCSIYLSYLDFRATGMLRTVPMTSSEDPGFASFCRRSGDCGVAAASV
jgi:hypothetical protein